MARGKKETKRQVENYVHKGRERLNNPPVGLVTPDTDKDAGKKTYAYDPHLDPQLVWAGKAEHTSFEVPTVSLHVHERIDPLSIVEAVKRCNGSGPQLSLFADPEQNPPIRQAIEFYKHSHNWTNRLIAGDSLLVMNSLLEKEGMEGADGLHRPALRYQLPLEFSAICEQAIVAEGDKDEDLTHEPENIKAFRDTWELGIHSYLTYLRDRMLLVRELLHESGSCFVQISDENLHIVRNIMDDVFGVRCHVVTIPVKKKGSQKSGLMDPVNDYLVWYSKSARDCGLVKFRPLFGKRELDAETLAEFRWVELPDTQEFSLSAVPGPDGTSRDYRLLPRQLFKDYPGARLFRPWPITNGGSRANQEDPIELHGRPFRPPKGRCWSHTSRTSDGSICGMERLKVANRLIASGEALDSRRYLADFPYKMLTNWWDGLGGAPDPIYVVQTNPEIVQRCILMTTDPGDLVLDPTRGSGTTAYVAEQWGRRWITCDTSRVSLALAKQRLMTAVFDYYELAHPKEGIASGFKYKTAPHITLKSIANNPEIREGMTREQIDAAIRKYADQETIYDQPYIDKKKTRVTGPFTVEAVPAPAVKPLDEVNDAAGDYEADAAITRAGETCRQGDWRDELLRTGIRGKAGQRIEFSRVEVLAGTRWLHADTETKDDKPQRVVVSFGPDHAPLEQRQVAIAIEEAQQLVPKPKMIVFAAFQFDPEASKDIDETNWPGVTLLKAQMNADLLTEDLKKKRASNESFWLIGQPDVTLAEITEGEDTGKYRLTVNGFDYYNTRTGEIESGGSNKIAMWMLDPDYDGRSLFPRQVFFPMTGEGDGWAKLAKTLKAEIDEALIEAYRSTVSLPFSAGDHWRAAVKIIDDRGIESLKVIRLG